MNYTDKDVRYTRTIEHKHFDGCKAEGSWVSTEYPVAYVPGEVDPYYPVNDDKNNALYERYRQLADETPNVIFGGRLAEYKYYDMDQVIASALRLCKEKLQ
jgi:UDP-galactopyranose mutase